MRRDLASGVLLGRLQGEAQRLGHARARVAALPVAHEQVVARHLGVGRARRRLEGARQQQLRRRHQLERVAAGLGGLDHLGVGGASAGPLGGRRGAELEREPRGQEEHTTLHRAAPRGRRVLEQVAQLGDGLVECPARPEARELAQRSRRAPRGEARHERRAKGVRHLTQRRVGHVAAARAVLQQRRVARLIRCADELAPDESLCADERLGGLQLKLGAQHDLAPPRARGEVHAAVEQEGQHAHARQQLEQRLRRPGVAQQQLIDLARLLLRPLAQVPAVVQRPREQPVRGAVDHQPRHLDEEQPLAPRRASRRAALRAALYRERKRRGGRAALRAVHGERMAAHLARLAAEVGVSRHHPVELHHTVRLDHLVQRRKRRAPLTPGVDVLT
eukprot:scaffold51640_cov68-Phaeocystis_antarctica.AAC.4